MTTRERPSIVLLRQVRTQLEKVGKKISHLKEAPQENRNKICTKVNALIAILNSLQQSLAANPNNSIEFVDLWDSCLEYIFQNLESTAIFLDHRSRRPGKQYGCVIAS